jgi:Bifunctional DNA primase/polymerase, N-terminal/AAA domain
VTNPYKEAATTYIDAGWRGVLPLPANAKWPPPKEYTGRGNPDPNPDTFISWLKDCNGNICLRLPDGIIGVDVDAYGDKKGAYTLQMLELELGYLPQTWRTTSRDDGTSGIRLFKIPSGLKWPSVMGDGIEIIRREHRYAVVWPSVHPSGLTYRWINPSGITAINNVPTPHELPDLPNEWVKHFTKLNKDDTLVRADIAPEEHQRIKTAVLTTGAPCSQVDEVIADFNEIMEHSATGSRHDACLAITLRLVALGAKGHLGVADAIQWCEQIFTQVISIDRGTPETAKNEWRSMIDGAIARQPEIKSEPCMKKNCTKELSGYKLELPQTEPNNPTIGQIIETDEIATWKPINLYDIFTGQKEPEKPTVLQRDDFKFLFYAAKVHSIYGEPESGKSLIVQYETARLINAGQRVLYIDCESDEHTMTDRLRRFGATTIGLENLTYVRPERSWKASIIEHEAWTELIDNTYTLAVIDGVTEALTLFGFETNDNDGITKFMRLIPRQIARHTKAATVLVDHIAKGASTRFAIGGQAKLAAIDGASYLVDVIEPPAIGKEGCLKMSITKDRPGQVRGHCITDTTKNNRIQLAAMITIDSTGDDTKMTIGAPDPEAATKQTQKQLEANMKSLHEWISANENIMNPNAFSANDVETNAKEIPCADGRHKKGKCSQEHIRELLQSMKDKNHIVSSGNHTKTLKLTGYYVQQNDRNDA